MEKRTSALARILAALALAVAVVAVVIAVSGAVGGGSSHGGGSGSGHAKKQHTRHRTRAKTYEIQSGDTLSSIARKTGVPIVELEALNPQVDPQILIAGETLKLR
jgi:LysM repeat protein